MSNQRPQVQPTQQNTASLQGSSRNQMHTPQAAPRQQAPAQVVATVSRPQQLIKENQTALRPQTTGQLSTAAQPRPQSTFQPATSQQRPQTSSQQPILVQQRPQTPGQQPIVVQQRPQTPVQQPIVVQQRPQTPGQQPMVVQQNLQTPGQQPMVVQQRPQTSGQQPIIIQQRTQISGQQPIIVQQRLIAPGQHQIIFQQRSLAPGQTMIIHQRPPTSMIRHSVSCQQAALRGQPMCCQMPIHRFPCGQVHLRQPGPGQTATTECIEEVYRPGPNEGLTEFLAKLHEYSSIIPDDVPGTFLNSSGIDSGDPRVLRLISMATQKFISDVTIDAWESCKLRNRQLPPAEQADKVISFTMEDLTSALRNNGVTIDKPVYFH